MDHRSVIFHFIVMVWGEAHTDLFLKISLPSLLAAGNLPSIRHIGPTGSRFHIYTTAEDAKRIKASPLSAQLDKILPVDIHLLLDNLKTNCPSERMGLCYNHLLNAFMKDDGAMVWIPPDAVWSDQSFANLYRIAMSGKRVVAPPCFRVAKETFLPVLQENFLQKDGTLCVPPQQLLNIALKHLHPITKTWLWRAPEFTSWPAVMLWKVGQEGLLARYFHAFPLMFYPETRGLLMNISPSDSLDGGPYLSNIIKDQESIYMVKDSDEIFCCEVSPSSYRVHPETPGGPKILNVALWAYKNTHPIQRCFFGQNVRIHGGKQTPLWGQVEQAADDAANAIFACLDFFEKVPEAYRELEGQSRIMNELALTVTKLKIDDAQAHNELGVEYYKMGRVKEAETALQKAVTVAPRLPDAHANLAVLYGEQAKLAKALEHIYRAMELDHQNPDTVLKCLKILEALGKVETAIHLGEQHLANHRDIKIQQELDRMRSPGKPSSAPVHPSISKPPGRCSGGSATLAPTESLLSRAEDDRHERRKSPVASKEYQYYEYCLKNNKPYFGKVMWALQGVPIRHAYMQCLVETQCRERTEKSFNILEIGSWAGGSALTWAEAIKKFNQGKGRVFCIDPWKLYFDPSKYSDLPQDQQEVYRQMAEGLSTGKIFDLFLHNIRVSRHEDIILPFKGSSEDLLPLFGEGRFDLVFVDGDHSYASVLKDLRGSARLVGEGGLLCGDDLELQLSQLDREHAELHKHMDYILDPKTKGYFHPGVSLAVGEFFGEVSTWEGFWAMRKEGGIWKKVELPKLPPDRLRLPEHLTGQSLPKLVKENYKGFNVVQYLGKHYALAQTLGPVDLTRIEDRTLEEYQTAGLCVIGKFLEETEQMIDQMSLPGSTNDYFSQGLALMRAGRLQEAVPAFLRAIEQSPRDPAFHNHLGVALYRLGNKADAEKSFRAAIQLGPNNVDARVSLAEICRQEDRYGEAVKYLKQAAQLAPQDIEVLAALGTLGMNLKDREAIHTAWQSLVAIDTNHPMVQKMQKALNGSPAARDHRS
jgi:Flp pilus assembly protein TadD/predicted O-methyltransferase YrrM